MEPTLSIIIPAYNEEQRLPLTLDRLFAYLSSHFTHSFEVIVADDGSKDKTGEKVKDMMREHSSLRILAFEKNRGRNAAVKDAVFATKTPFILEMDADGSVDPEAIPRFFSYLAAHSDVDMLIGARNITGSKITKKQPFLRVFLGNGFLLLMSVFFGWRMKDRVNGFKMFRRVAAEDIFRHQTLDYFLAEAEIVVIADRRGWISKELPVMWADNRDSRIRPFKEALRSFRGIFEILVKDWKGEYRRD